MWKAKRSGGDLCRNEWILGRLLGDSNPDVWTGLSDGLKSYLSKSVASIVLFDGDDILFSCSGIALEHQGRRFTRFLTTAGLVRALNATTKRQKDVKIRVRHEGTELYRGYVAARDMDHNFAVVNVYAFLDVQFGPFQCALESLPHGEVLAVGRGVSGKMMGKIVELNGDSRVSKNGKDLYRKISKPWEGGPLLSFDGNMVGMNLFLTTTKAVFLPWGTILKHYVTPQQKVTGLAVKEIEGSQTIWHLRFAVLNVYQSKYLPTFGMYKTDSQLPCTRHEARPVGEKSNSQEQLDLDSDGYPKLPSTMLGAPVKLVYSFEDPFGDKYGEGAWKRFNKGASNLDRNVVVLASFNGEKRFFVCTGTFIKWNGSTVVLTSASLVRKSGDENKIDEDLRIEVWHDGQYKNGVLQRCNLHYNIALVSVKDCRDLRSSNTQLFWESSFEVAAVGRFFKTGKLMATSGNLVSWSGTLDCEFIARSTCKIKKAGIGGPLVNLDGDVIGMNFYDTRIGTPFLLWEDICKILASFETKSEPGDVGNAFGPLFWKMPRDDKDKVNRWPVPTPRWCFPEDVESSDDELVFVPESGQIKYGYTRGQRVNLL